MSKSSRPTLGVGAIVFRAGEVLLIRRGKAPGKGRWSVPGGRVEAGETLRQAARRELLEETGIRARLGALVCVVERRTGKGHYVIVDFVGSAPPRAKPRAGSDALDTGFFPRTRLPAPATRGLAEAVRLAWKSRNRRKPALLQ